MKKGVKTVIAVLSIMAILILTGFSYVFIVTADVNLNEDKLINTEKTVIFYDDNGSVIKEENKGRKITDLQNVPSFVKNAFIAIEDKRFYKHNGIDDKAIFRAVINNIKSFSLKEGASTISQQLIKNTHLSNKKTINRKLAEMKLAKSLEKKYTKDEILEMYLNTIYFGHGCYGITDASKYYFDKLPQNLSVNESAILASIIKSPAFYTSKENNDAIFERKNLVLKEMFSQNFIDETTYSNEKEKSVYLNSNEDSFSDYIWQTKKELSNILNLDGNYNGKLHVYTSFSSTLQKYVDTAIDDKNLTYNKCAIILDKNNNVKAFYSNCQEPYRQMGSTVKPLLVYAPSLELNTIDSCSQFSDEKTDFNGYSPSNYNDKYYGYVSAKQALAKSSNVCAVKILSLTGIDKCLNFLKKTDIPVTNEDDSLSLALGSTKTGASLKQITGAYNVFINEGYYKSPSYIEKIEFNGKTIYQNSKFSKKIFSKDTAYIMNDMLSETVKDGTAKKLSFLPYPLRAKTGTVGNKEGNTDAYCISYNNDYLMGVWVGNKENTLLPNHVTGGNQPATVSKNIWEDIFGWYTPSKFKDCEDVIKLDIDKISYETEHVIELSNENTPKRYRQTELFRKSNTLKNVSSRFLNPFIENSKLSINNNEIIVQLCLPQWYNAKLYREFNGKKEEIYNFNGFADVYVDKNLKDNSEYTYYAVPYYDGIIDRIYGEEKILGKIKTPTLSVGEDWWQYD